MENLGQYLVDFLNAHPQVYLPGIGLFKKERIASSFDPESQTFSAPSQQIVLETTEREEKDLFLQFLSEKLDLPLEETESLLNKRLGLWLLDANENGNSLLVGFGTLIKQEDKLFFDGVESSGSAAKFYEPVKEIYLLPPSEQSKELAPPPSAPESGLLPVEEDAAPSFKEGSVFPIEEDSNTNSQESQEKVLAEVESTFESKNHDVSGTSTWVWATALVVLIIAALGYWFIQVPAHPDAIHEPVTTVNTPSSSQPVPPLTDSLTQNNEGTNDPAKEIQDSVGNSAENNLISQKSDIPEITYEVIVVSFGKLADAESYVNLMKSKGHDLHIVPNNYSRNQVKVSCGSFSSAEEAQEALNSVRESFAKDAWIYKKTHNN